MSVDTMTVGTAGFFYNSAIEPITLVATGGWFDFHILVVSLPSLALPTIFVQDRYFDFYVTEAVSAFSLVFKAGRVKSSGDQPQRLAKVPELQRRSFKQNG